MRTNALALAQLQNLPLVAILRGLETERAQAVGERLYEAGFRALEVPLNRPQAHRCIELLCRTMPADMVIGAGTVITAEQVRMVEGAGGTLIVSPHCDEALVGLAVAQGLFCVPGVFTASEALRAWRAGAHALKVFPADALGPAGLQALVSVLPCGLALWPVGGIGPHNLQAWREAGASGFGIGTQVFRPSDTLEQITAQAQRCVAAWQQH